MAEAKPIKLEDLGGGAGRLAEFAPGDTLPKAALPELSAADVGAVAADDPRLSDARAPTGGAGGVLSGSYPNPGFAVDMATQDELDSGLAGKVDKVAGKQLSTEDYTSAEKTKLGGVAAGATANATDAQLRDRSLHTGTQAASTISDFVAAVRGSVLTGLSTATSTAVAATDTVLAALGKLQAQITSLVTSKQDKLTSGTTIKTINGVSVLGGGDLVIEAGGGGLTLFEESRSVASPNDTVPVHALTALGAETDIDFVIASKGTGAIVAQVPDGTAAGGNKRGAGAVDLQTTRSGPTQVASGTYSVGMGGSCTASGTYSVAIGNSCTSSSIASVAIGNTCIASGIGSVAMGSGARAISTNSVAMGGSVTTRGVEGVISEGNGASAGRQQMERIPLRFDTTTSAPAQLTSNGSTAATLNSATMPNNSAYYCRLRVLARNTTTNESMSWSGTALIKRGANAASTTLIGSSITSDFGDAAMAACTVTLSADTTQGGLAVIVTGLASTTVRWVAQLETVEAA